MPFPSLKIEQARDVVERVEAKLREGYRPQGMTGSGPGAVQAAAEEAVKDGVVGATASFVTRLRVARSSHNLEPDWSAYRPRQYLQRPPGMPVIPPQSHLVEDEPEGTPERIVVIGDAHDSPHLPDKSRFYWLGRFIAERKPDRVVSVGDWWTMDCFSNHQDRSTFDGLAKPTFEQDRASFHESQQAFHEGLGGYKCKRDCTLGNHEHRAWRYTNLHPDGLSYAELVVEAFAQWGWRTTPYGEYRFIGGVGFTHTPLNGLGRPMGGVTGGQRAANAAMWDVVHGDSHKAQISVAEKLGPVRAPTIYNSATALPPGFIEGYANRGGSTWRSGVCEAIVWGGHVRSWSFTEMALLRHWYDRKAAA